MPPLTLWRARALDTVKPVKDEVADVVAHVANLSVLAATVQNRGVDKLPDNPAFLSAADAPINNAGR
jgi:hypothetical protein